MQNKCKNIHLYKISSLFLGISDSKITIFNPNPNDRFEFNMTEMFSSEDFTMVKNPGKENMEIITKEGKQINKYTPSDDQSSKDGNKGKRVGVAYQLENGEIIYVPE